MKTGFTPEGFPTENLPYGTESSDLDEVYVVCDAEFNSRKDVHESFTRARGIKSWARFFLKYEVQQVAKRNGFTLSGYQSELIALKVSENWFLEAATARN